MGCRAWQLPTPRAGTWHQGASRGRSESGLSKLVIIGSQPELVFGDKAWCWGRQGWCGVSWGSWNQGVVTVGTDCLSLEAGSLKSRCGWAGFPRGCREGPCPPLRLWAPGVPGSQPRPPASAPSSTRPLLGISLCVSLLWECQSLFHCDLILAMCVSKDLISK